VCDDSRVPDFVGENLTGSRFGDVCLTGAGFHDVDRSNARFGLAGMTGVVIGGAALTDMTISGWIDNLLVNGVDVVPLVQAELDRRYPGRAKMRPADAGGFREAWAILERLWHQTVDRARGMAPELLRERVDEEWSFIETLRHLVFATDAWVRRDLRPAGAVGPPLTYRTMTCPASPACRVIGPRGRRWRRCSRCALTGWPPCARCWPI
jgi:uncharacterized protein YjbI with pentapeptide repeats